MTFSVPGYEQVRVEIVRGQQAILERLPLLTAAAVGWGQSEEVAELPFLLSVPGFPRANPLLLLLHSGTRKDEVEELAGAILVFAYLGSVFGERLLSHPDAAGRRCVFGPAEERIVIAVIAARTVLENGAALLTLRYRNGENDSGAEQDLSGAPDKAGAIAALGMLGLKGVAWDLCSATRQMELPLEIQFDETIKRMGKRTRRNIRAAMRRFLREMGSSFEIDPILTEQDLFRTNAACTHPFPGRVVRWRYKVAKQHPGAFLAGLRSATGEWMALAGGRQVGEVVTLDWQMNVRKFGSYSVSLVMRGFLMEHFGREGVTCMRFEGGTRHTLAKACRSTTVYTLRVRRQSIALRALEQCITTCFPERAITRTLFGSGERDSMAQRKIKGS